MPLANPVYIEAPAVAPAAGGLYAVANVMEGDVHIGASGFHYLSENCGVASGIDDPACITAAERAAKTFDETDVIASTDPFAVYKGVSCVDLHDDDTDWARRGLELTEHIAVEEGVMGQLLAGATDITPTPGTAIPVRHGIALLEGIAAANYGGVPVLHMARSTATIGFSERVLEHDLNFMVTTMQGALVANGGGYELNLSPAGAEAAAGEAWIYVTGAVTVVRGPVTAIRVIPGTGAEGGHLNNQLALAERLVAVSAECIKYAVLVELVV
jgi:hypothetical protein